MDQVEFPAQILEELACHLYRDADGMLLKHYMLYLTVVSTRGIFDAAHVWDDRIELEDTPQLNVDYIVRYSPRH